MSQIVLENKTGRRNGNFIHYSWGSDLFGYMYLDIVRRKKHRADLVKRLVFDNPKDLIFTLDIDLYNKENLHYEPLFSGAPETEIAS